MKVAVVAANGKVGQLVVDECLARGLDVTAIVRSENKTKAKHSIVADILTLTKEQLAPFDVIVNAIGVWEPNQLAQHSQAIEHLTAILNPQQRLIVVGGAGSLYVDDQLTIKLMDTADFPAEYKPIAQAMSDALDLLRSKTNINWTYISPAAFFDAEGTRYTKYILAGEKFILNHNNESIISYADYAIALVDEIINAKHNQQRISVVGDY